MGERRRLLKKTTLFEGDPKEAISFEGYPFSDGSTCEGLVSKKKKVGLYFPVDKSTLSLIRLCSSRSGSTISQFCTQIIKPPFPTPENTAVVNSNYVSKLLARTKSVVGQTLKVYRIKSHVNQVPSLMQWSESSFFGTEGWVLDCVRCAAQLIQNFPQ